MGYSCCGTVRVIPRHSCSPCATTRRSSTSRSYRVRRTVRCSSASTTAPPSSPTWSTWWSFTSLTEECCPASSNTHAPLWPCDTPPPQTFLCTPLSLRSPSLPFCPLYPFPYQRSGGWGDGEKLRPVLRMWTTLQEPGLEVDVTQWVTFVSTLLLLGCLNESCWDRPSVEDCGLLRLFCYWCSDPRERPAWCETTRRLQYVSSGSLGWIPSFRVPNPSAPPTFPILQAW